MKKVLAAAVLTASFSLTGCASYNPWDSIPYQEASAWQGIGVQAYDAKTLRSNGFTPTDTKNWIQAGIKSPQTIIEWNKAGFTPRTAAKWIAKNFTLENAISFKKQGLTVE